MGSTDQGKQYEANGCLVGNPVHHLEDSGVSPYMYDIDREAM
jgi:hypothetical protein